MLSGVHWIFQRTAVYTHYHILAFHLSILVHLLRYFIEDIKRRALPFSFYLRRTPATDSFGQLEWGNQDNYSRIDGLLSHRSFFSPFPFNLRILKKRVYKGRRVQKEVRFLAFSKLHQRISHHFLVPLPSSSPLLFHRPINSCLYRPYMHLLHIFDHFGGLSHHLNHLQGRTSHHQAGISLQINWYCPLHRHHLHRQQLELQFMHGRSVHRQFRQGAPISFFALLFKKCHENSSILSHLQPNCTDWAHDRLL